MFQHYQILFLIKPPTIAKECKSFAGKVNFASIFCSELQKLLKPIYDLTRKGKQFVWGVGQQNAFKEIKQRLQKPPVLYMSDKIGRFQLYSDTSKMQWVVLYIKFRMENLS